MLLTIIGYIIGTGATVIGAYYTYKQYIHSKQIRNNEGIIINSKETEKINRAPVTKVLQIQDTKNIDSNIPPLPGGNSKIAILLKSTKDDYYKNVTLQKILGDSKSLITEEEVLNIISQFKDDYYRNQAIQLLMSRTKKPISEKTFSGIVSTFSDDFYKNIASESLMS